MTDEEIKALFDKVTARTDLPDEVRLLINVLEGSRSGLEAALGTYMNSIDHLVNRLSQTQPQSGGGAGPPAEFGKP